MHVCSYLFICLPVCVCVSICASVPYELFIPLSQLVPYKATLAYMKAHLSKTGKSRSAKTPINPVIPGAESECRTRGDTQV